MKTINRVYNKTKKKSIAVPSQKQLTVRGRFTIANVFLMPLRRLINRVYKITPGSVRPDGFFGALSHMMRYAIEGEYPGLQILYSMVKLSAGKLEPAAETLFLAEGGMVMISWAVTISSDAWEDDEATAVIYNSSKEVFYVRRRIALRKEGVALSDIPSEFEGDTLHGYFFFRSRDGKNASESVYLGIAGR